MDQFQLAHQGTLFRDEIGDVPLDLQSKLLRVLQEHELEQTGWVIGGPHGAAARLGVKRTSLASTMRRLGIVRPRLQRTGAGELRAR